MVNTDSSLSKTPFNKLNKKWKQFLKGGLNRKELLLVETIAATSLGATALDGNFLLEDPPEFPASLLKKSGENLLKLLHGSSKLQIHGELTGSFPDRFGPQRFRKLRCRVVNNSNSLSHQAAAVTSNSSKRMVVQTTNSSAGFSAPLKSWGSSALTPFPRHMEPLVLSSPTSKGKSLLEILKRNSSTKPSLCALNSIQSVEISKTNGNVVIDHHNSIPTQRLPLFSSLVNHRHSCPDYSQSDSDVTSGISHNMLINGNSNYTGIAATGHSSPGRPFGSTTDLSEFSSTCPFTVKNRKFSLSPSSPSLEFPSNSLVNKSSGHRFTNSSSSSPSSALLSSSLSLLAGESSSTRTSSSTGYSASKCFNTRKVQSHQYHREYSCRQSDYKFANPLYMRSPEPDAIPIPSWQRSSVAATF